MSTRRRMRMCTQTNRQLDAPEAHKGMAGGIVAPLRPGELHLFGAVAA